MIYQKNRMVTLARQSNFIKDNIEKTLRLTEILKYFNINDPFKGRFALKGGTAINLVAINLPRLSIDIDLDFTVDLPKEEVTKMREIVDTSLIEYASSTGYNLNKGVRSHHALSSYTLRYTNSAGNIDTIKVDINYINRCHIFPVKIQPTLANQLIESFDILTLDTTELYAGKINALLSRSAPRDLYDVYHMIKHNIVTDKDMLRKCIIFYNMISGKKNINNINYSNIEKIDFQLFKRELKPVISKKDKFNVDQAKQLVIEYIKNLIKLTDNELLFVEEFKDNHFLPNLLFDDKQIVQRIIKHPMALWRCGKL